MHSDWSYDLEVNLPFSLTYMTMLAQEPNKVAVQIHLNSQRRQQETHHELPSVPMTSHLLQADAALTIDLTIAAGTQILCIRLESHAPLLFS